MRTVVVVAFDDIQLLDLAGPVEVLTAANFLGATPPYEIIVATPDGKPIRTQSGVNVAPDASLAALRRRRRPIDTLVVVGGLRITGKVATRSVAGALEALSKRARRTTSVCTGALVLAASGLLDGYRATTHWSKCDRLAERHPQVEVLPDQIYVHDRDRWTSAGVTAGIDLFLAIVEADHGRELAHAISGWLVVFVRRPGGQAQFSVQQLTQPAQTPAIRELQLWLVDHLADRHTVETLAYRAGMSPRHFARIFRAETGTTPAAYIEALRIEAARRLLETTDLTVGAIAKAVGLGRPETLHRAFRRQVGTTPSRYREHFGDLGR